MPRSLRTLTVTLVAALAVASAAFAGGGDPRRIRGVVSDGSGGVLPGVTVVATADDGHIVGNAVTDGVGRYTIGELPEVAVTLTFQIDGFATAVVGLAVIEPN